MFYQKAIEWQIMVVVGRDANNQMYSVVGYGAKEKL